MKKPFSFRARDPHFVCKDCGRALKKNVIVRKKTVPDYCYKCGRDRRLAHTLCGLLGG